MSISYLNSFHISSLDRDDGIIENFTIDLNIDSDLKNKFNMVSITSFVCPKSYYNIQSGSYFILYENNIPINIYIEEGNYNRTQLNKILIQKCNLQTLNNVVYNFQLNKTNYEDGRLRISCDKPLIIKKLLFVENELYDCMGFFKDKEYIFTTELISERIQNFNSNNMIYLHSNLVSSDINDFKSSGNNILALLNNCGSCSFFSYIQKDYDMIHNMKKLKFNSIMNFYITSENRLINLNNCDFNFTLNLFYYQDNYPLYKKLSNFINYSLVNENNNEDENIK